MFIWCCESPCNSFMTTSYFLPSLKKKALTLCPLVFLINFWLHYSILFWFFIVLFFELCYTTWATSQFQSWCAGRISSLWHRMWKSNLVNDRPIFAHGFGTVLFGFPCLVRTARCQEQVDKVFAPHRQEARSRRFEGPHTTFKGKSPLTYFLQLGPTP